MKPSPRLSVKLSPGKRGDSCQLCGLTFFFQALTRWREHDDRGKPGDCVVRLCEECALTLIPKQHRRYSKLPANEPFPGVMAFCVTCRHRRGPACGHPKARVNGGKGVQIVIEPPVRYVEDGTAPTHEVRVFWPSPATGCRQREV